MSANATLTGTNVTGYLTSLDDAGLQFNSSLAAAQLAALLVRACRRCARTI